MHVRLWASDGGGAIAPEDLSGLVTALGGAHSSPAGTQGRIRPRRARLPGPWRHHEGALRMRRHNRSASTGTKRPSGRSVTSRSLSDFSRACSASRRATARPSRYLVRVRVRVRDPNPNPNPNPNPIPNPIPNPNLDALGAQLVADRVGGREVLPSLRVHPAVEQVLHLGVRVRVRAKVRV